MADKIRRRRSTAPNPSAETATMAAPAIHMAPTPGPPACGSTATRRRFAIHIVASLAIRSPHAPLDPPGPPSAVGHSQAYPSSGTMFVCGLKRPM